MYVGSQVPHIINVFVSAMGNLNARCEVGIQKIQTVVYYRISRGGSNDRFQRHGYFRPQSTFVSVNVTFYYKLEFLFNAHKI